MSSVQPANSQPSDPARIRAAIASAAHATGVDFDYLLAQARIESNLDPHAAASTSSARGLYQFLGGTWLDTLDRHGSEHGLGWASAAIERSGGRAHVADPAMRAQIMNLRHDPAVSAIMAGELAGDNAAVLEGVLGRAPDQTELYLAHFLGSGGASRFLTALADDPGRPAANLFAGPAAANRAIFFKGDGGARSLAEVMGVLRDKMARAGAVDGAAGMGSGSFYGSWAHGSAPPAAPPAMPGSGSAGAPRPPMSELLRTTFIADGAAASAGGERVRAAYARLKAFDL